MTSYLNDRPSGYLFTGSAGSYDRFMGRYSNGLARALADTAKVGGPARVLDVGCGPGALTAVLAERVGPEKVAAIDPAPQFTAACRARVPGADIRTGVAEHLPWGDGQFDAVLSCLVIAFMTDPDRALREMRRVTRPGGVIAVCMWDTAAGGMMMLSLFWAAVRQVDPASTGERSLAGTHEGDIAERLAGAGLSEVASGALTVSAAYADFADLWEPFTHGIGPAGQHLVSLRPEQRAMVHDRYRDLVAGRTGRSTGSFALDARAWYATGRVP
ncbi:MAG TPA: class I SAM-dependent methyltransferase [Nocardioidaceae bacterium]|nr:class I SAM-dependent methyltransferase [Nocardioidaceae bacterium]